MEIPSVAIIGAGPIGIELAIALKRLGVSTLHFDANQIGHTFTWWPRETEFFSTTERIELAGVPIPNTNQGRTTGEGYLAYLRSLVEQFDLHIRTYERVLSVSRQEEAFLIRTQTLGGEFEYQAHNVVVATGDMHAPNRLNIPGEDLPHVSHYFTDPHTYFRKKLLIVGGRNSAVEAALRCWRAGVEVTLSYRQEEISDRYVKHFLLPDLLTQIEIGTIEYLPLTTPVEICPSEVILQHKDGTVIHQPVDFVYLATGFVARMDLLRNAGVELVGASQAPQHDIHTMETNIPGLYVAGTAAAGTQLRYTYFIENCHIHVGRIVQAITGEWPQKLGTVPARQYELPEEKYQTN